MSDEIRTTGKVVVTKNNVSITNSVSTKTQTMQSTLSAMHQTTQAVGTSAEDLSTGDVDITKEYGVLIYNRDSTNYVDIILRKDATPTDADAARIRPGESFGPIRARAQSGGYPKYRLQANTAACNCEVLVWDCGDPAL